MMAESLLRFLDATEFYIKQTRCMPFEIINELSFNFPNELENFKNFVVFWLKKYPMI